MVGEDDRNDGQAKGMTCLRRAVTHAADPVEAARELHRVLAGPEMALVLLFCSPEYATAEFAREIQRLFAGSCVVGCTTAGEIGPEGYQENSVTGVSFARPEFEALAALLVEGGEVEMGRCGETVAHLRAELARRLAQQPGLAHQFALLLIDSTSRREEEVASLIGSALSDLPVLGGSAGDALRFERTSVLLDGRFHPEAAILVLVATSRPVHAFRNQHFVSSDRKMVVTGAEPARRLVTEFDAEPAVEVYARLVGCPVDELTPMIFATHPLVVRLGGAEYVRSIQKANPDGSLSFYCAIDEGLVLTLAEGHDLLTRMEGLFSDLRQRIGPPQLVIGFECVLNRLEAERNQIKHRLSRLHAANNVTGFASYGEQWGLMHVNQTFTGIAIGGSP
jgi:hypothetical protein